MGAAMVTTAMEKMAAITAENFMVRTWKFGYQDMWSNVE